MHEAMRQGLLGFIKTPLQGNALIPGVTWCADNGCYGKGYPGDDAWLAWLDKYTDHIDRCLFATAPDVMGDAAASMNRSRPFLPQIRTKGYPAALVAQDGMEDMELPWDEFDVLFIGGTTDWKLSTAARDLVLEGNRRGKHTHFGRVNSRKRLRYAHYSLDCNSVDGTYLVFGPAVNLPKLLRWLSELDGQPPLFLTV